MASSSPGLTLGFSNIAIPLKIQVWDGERVIVKVVRGFRSQN